MEKFKVTVIRNIFIKIISLLLIFIFVKSKDDLWIYTLILSGSTLVSQMILLPLLFKEIEIEKISIKDIKKHIKPIFLLFIPIIAVSLYKVMDKIMIGMICDVSEVGLYEQAEKITQMPLSLIIALGTVMMPKISNLFYKEKYDEILIYIEKSINFEMFLCMPIVFGLITISNNFVPIFLGTDFQNSSVLLNLLSITLIFICFANVLRTEYLIPNNRDKHYIFSVIIGALVNLIINLILINKYASIGACIGTIMAEFAVATCQTIFLKEELPIKKYIANCIPFLLKAIIMLIIIYPFNWLNINKFIILFIQIILGGCIYILLNIKYILSIININKVFSKLNIKRKG